MVVLTIRASSDRQAKRSSVGIYRCSLTGHYERLDYNMASVWSGQTSTLRINPSAIAGDRLSFRPTVRSAVMWTDLYKPSRFRRTLSYLESFAPKDNTKQYA